MASGIEGLDIVLDGGLIDRTTYLLAGAPGTGKTVLSQQIAFNFARHKPQNNVLILTLLSESHEKLINNLASFSFFDEKLIGSRIQFLSLYQEIMSQGLERLLAISRQSANEYKARLVIIEGVSAIRDFALNRLDMRRVIFDLNTQLNSLGCMLIMVVDDEQIVSNAPEYGLADTIIRLYHNQYNGQQIRQLEILKSRAAASLTGHHSFEINRAGLVVYPRLEAKLSQVISYHMNHDRPQREVINLVAPDEPLTAAAPTPQRASFAIAGLDEMLDGGLLPGSINLILGTPGSGKTLTGLRFIYEGAVQGEKGLMLTFNNSPQALILASRQMGFDLAPFVDNGMVEIKRILPVENVLDKVGGQLVDAIEAQQTRRLLIDSVNDLERLCIQEERLDNFWAVLSHYLRNRNLTTLGILNFNQFIGSGLEVPDRPLTTIADTILLLRSLEMGGELKRLISVLEMRGSNHTAKVREFLIKPDGLQVGEPFKDVENLLGGASKLRTDRGQA